MTCRAVCLIVLLSTLLLTPRTFAQEVPAPHPDAATPPRQNGTDQKLTLAAAQTVFLTATVGEVLPTAYGRARASADRALAELKKAVARWHRFELVDSPDRADLVLIIVESNHTSGIREGALNERLLVARGRSTTSDSVMWKSTLHEGGLRDYRPVAKTVEEFRALLEQYDKNLPADAIAQARAANPKASSQGCGQEQKDDLDCLANSTAQLFLPQDREENKGAVQLSEAALNVSPLDMMDRISTNEFSDYVVAIQKLLHQQFTPSQQGAGWDIAVIGVLKSDGKPELSLRSRPNTDQKQLQTFYDHLQALAAPKVNGKPLEFRIIFAVWGGSPESNTK